MCFCDWDSQGFDDLEIPKLPVAGGYKIPGGYKIQKEAIPSEDQKEKCQD